MNFPSRIHFAADSNRKSVDLQVPTFKGAVVDVHLLRLGRDLASVIGIYRSPDRHFPGKISAKTQQMNVDYSAFEGWDLRSTDTVTVRGKVQVRDGKFIGELGHGTILEATTNAFLG